MGNDINTGGRKATENEENAGENGGGEENVSSNAWTQQNEGRILDHFWAQAHTFATVFVGV